MPSMESLGKNFAGLSDARTAAGAGPLEVDSFLSELCVGVVVDETPKKEAETDFECVYCWIFIIIIVLSVIAGGVLGVLRWWLRRRHAEADYSSEDEAGEVESSSAEISK